MHNDSITIYMNVILQDAYLAHIFRCVKKPSTSISRAFDNFVIC